MLAPADDLERRLRAPALESLVEFEWRGFNTGWAPRLLGKAYLALGALRLASNYFILERLRATA